MQFCQCDIPITAQYSIEKMQLFYGDGGLGTFFMVTHRLNVVVIRNSTFYEFVVMLRKLIFFSGSLMTVDHLAGFSIKFYSSKHKRCVISKFATYNTVISPF
jgi:hypothetical protein